MVGEMNVSARACICMRKSMGVRRGGQGGLLPLPGRPMPAKNSMFLDFFGKNSIFFVALQAKSRFLALLENFCPPLEKSLRTPMRKSCVSVC
jgi:hypothetical protein